MIGRTFGHYRVVEPLGAGGMGEVYRAHDDKLDRDVALKVLPEGALSDPDARRRFRREANALSRLSHPHIASIFDFDTADGVDYLVMEMVPGHSMRDELALKGVLPEAKVVQLGAQMARGLQAAHKQGVIHRDLKPANVQLTPDGTVKILDFGLARVAPRTRPVGESEPTETVAGAAGTLAYMSPEQLRGRGVDQRSDLYSLGPVLYEMATGRRLFKKASSAELTGAILNETPTPPREANEQISPALEALILKAVDKDQELRYQTARDLVVDLERLQLRSERPSEAAGVPLQPADGGPPAPGSAGVGPSARRAWTLAAIAACAVVLAVVWWLWPPLLPRITDIRPLGLDVGPTYPRRARVLERGSS